MPIFLLNVHCRIYKLILYNFWVSMTEVMKKAKEKKKKQQKNKQKQNKKKTKTKQNKTKLSFIVK